MPDLIVQHKLHALTESGVLKATTECNNQAEFNSYISFGSDKVSRKERLGQSMLFVSL